MAAKCLETRTTPEGFRRRRYVTADGVRFTTLEIPATVARDVGIKRLRVANEKYRRGHALRERGARIDKRIREGVKPASIAAEFGVTEAAVRQRRAKIQKEKT